MLELKNCLSLNRILLFAAAFIVRATRQRQTAPQTEVHTRYSRIGRDVTGGEWQRSWTEEASKTLYARVKAFKRILGNGFVEH